MATYVALLRGINVGGHKKIKMDNLRSTIEKAGFKNVRTYIQSGNLVFESALETTTAIAGIIKDSILHDFGYNVPVIVKTSTAFKTIIKDNPIDELIIEKSYFTLVASTVSKEKIESFNALQWENETAYCNGTCVYLYFNKPYNKVKCNSSFIEQLFKIETTTRNYRTMQALLKLLPTQ